MKYLIPIRAPLLISAVIFFPLLVHACRCGGIHGRNVWDTARVEAESANAIFEGIPEQFELRWNVLEARDGDFVPAYSPNPHAREGWPRMVVTFRVLREYKGHIGSKIQLSTGLGGGDCGARFSTGLTYLVYAESPGTGKMSVSMCSPGGWIGADEIATDLRYLKNQRPWKEDLASPEPLNVRMSLEYQEHERRRYEEFQKRYATVTGNICGTVLQDSSKANGGKLSFLSTQGFSPIEHPDTQVKPDGSFCSPRLGPGKYYLYFDRGSSLELPVAFYYPGVRERAKAALIDVSAGETKSNIVLKSPPEKSYSVRGFVSTNEKAGLSANDVFITLFDLDRETWFQQAIDFQGSFPLLKTKYFAFEHVLPGHYAAFASVMGQGWLTKRVDVTVGAHSKFIWLEILRTK